jgi:hypothetical protein
VLVKVGDTVDILYRPKRGLKVLTESNGSEKCIIPKAMKGCSITDSTVCCQEGMIGCSGGSGGGKRQQVLPGSELVGRSKTLGTMLSVHEVVCNHYR